MEKSSKDPLVFCVKFTRQENPTLRITGLVVHIFELTLSGIRKIQVQFILGLCVPVGCLWDIPTCTYICVGMYVCVSVCLCVCVCVCEECGVVSY